MHYAIVNRPALGKCRGVLLAALIIVLSGAMPSASPAKANNALAATPPVLNATTTVNALLLRGEYSLFYSGFEH